MPRIYTSESYPIDFCKKHMPSEKEAWHKFGMLGNGPDGRGNCFGYDAEHPDYEDGYSCHVCRVMLTERDD